MLPYYIMVASPILFTLLLGQHNEGIKEKKKNSIITWSFFGFLLLILMIRDESIGADTGIYLKFFEQVQIQDFKETFINYETEHGFLILNKLISIFSTKEQVLIAIMSIICTVPIAVVYAKESENPLLTISIFLIGSNFNMLFSGFRQAIACAIIMIAFIFVKNKKLIPFLLFVLLAITFHKSAIVTLLIYPFYHINITKGKIIALIPVVGAIFVLRNQIFEMFTSVFEEYSMYELEETEAYTMIILFALFLIFSYVVPADDKMDRETIGLRNIMLLAFIFQIFALTSPIAMRMNYYNTLFVPLLLPKIINRTSDDNKRAYKVVGTIIAAFFIFYYFYRALTGEDILQLYPYKSMWS